MVPSCCSDQCHIAPYNLQSLAASRRALWPETLVGGPADQAAQRWPTRPLASLTRPRMIDFATLKGARPGRALPRRKAVRPRFWLGVGLAALGVRSRDFLRPFLPSENIFTLAKEIPSAPGRVIREFCGSPA